jgi:predicted permease
VRSFLVYTAARMLVLAVLGLLLYVVGLRGLPLAAVAVLLSLPVSYVLLARQRVAFGADIERRLAERRTRTDRVRSQLRGEDDTG